MTNMCRSPIPVHGVTVTFGPSVKSASAESVSLIDVAGTSLLACGSFECG